jgi:hypothetical protein
MNHSRSAEGDANAGVLVGPSFPAVMRGGEVELELLKMGAFVAAEMTPHLFASGVKMPVLMVQVLEDEWTRNPEDTQKNLRSAGKHGQGTAAVREHQETLPGRLQLLRKASGKDHRLLRQAHEMSLFYERHRR